MSSFFAVRVSTERSRTSVYCHGIRFGEDTIGGEIVDREESRKHRRGARERIIAGCLTGD